MSLYDQAFDPNILIGHCDLISRFSDVALYPDTQLVYFSYFFQIMSEYDQTFDPNILIGHCDLISRFSDIDTQMVYEQTSAYDKTFDPEVVLGHYDLIAHFSDFVISRHSIGI